jgi:spermidine synthase
MNLFGKMPSLQSIHRRAGVEVRERDGVRTLHLGSDIVQSAMRLDRPDALELAYTRSMMAFLLFEARQRRCLLIGLGGGSIAKFLYRNLPGLRIQAIESRPEVVAVARSHFELPPDDARLRVVVADGGEYVRGHSDRFDAILIDAFDSSAPAEVVSAGAFYQDCRAALTRSGVMAVNLWSSEGTFDANLQRIEHAFEHRCLCLPSERPGNVIVFGFAGNRQSYAWEELRSRADALEASHALGYPRFVTDLRRMNLHDEHRVELG